VARKPTEDRDLRREYDFRDGVRGKYVRPGRRLVVELDAELTAEFGDAASVLSTLRRVVAARRARASRRSRG
jgi:hypothetical protein